MVVGERNSIPEAEQRNADYVVNVTEVVATYI